MALEKEFKIGLQKFLIETGKEYNVAQLIDEWFTITKTYDNRLIVRFRWAMKARPLYEGEERMDEPVKINRNLLTFLISIVEEKLNGDIGVLKYK